MKTHRPQDLVRGVTGEERHKHVPLSCGGHHKCIWHQNGSFRFFNKGHRQHWDSNLGIFTKDF
uniref:Uncharacterized protein n=1 Tax=Anguilla anguilla TaxID=7936 RepID=A0A0E9UTG4_ANGAN